MTAYPDLRRRLADSGKTIRELSDSPIRLGLSRLAALASLAIVTIACGGFSAFAQDGRPAAIQPNAAQGPNAVAGSASAEMRETLGWLDRYLTDQVLFKKEDVEKIRKKVAAMSREELQRWHSETAAIRATLESDQWRETGEWLREFLKVQAIYSDEEVEQLRQKAANASPSELHDILMDIERKHDSLRSMHAVSNRQRQSSLATRQRHLQQQNAAQQSAARGSSSYGSRPLFGNTQNAAAARQSRDSRYRAPAPIITSRGVARESVYRSVFGGHGSRW